MSNLDFADIQGHVLRGYRMGFVRHFVLRIDNAPAARAFLATLTAGEAEAPQITSAAPWTSKPSYCLNIGFTYAGLKAINVPEASLQTFSAEFREGPGPRAEQIGDVGESAPDHWIGGLAVSAASPSPAHVLLTLYAHSSDEREYRTAQLWALFGADGGIMELSHQDGQALPDGRVHFGYVDGLSQPAIEGGPPLKRPDDQPAAPPGEFLLGYSSQYEGYAYPVPQPCALGKNGSFAAYRIFRQDVIGFEKFLTQAAQTSKLNREMIAAKLCGRWRNGVPISLSPDTDTPSSPLPREELNAFDYVPTPAYPDMFNDVKGLRCPIGAHIRRSNPRSQRVAGGSGHLRRIIRRSMPYGPHYNPHAPDDGAERGLLMLAICVSLADQFEFLMNQWVNGTLFAAGVSGPDPVIGNVDPAATRFVIPMEDGPNITLEGFSRFVMTQGSAYCFLPSLTAIRYLAALPA